MIRMMSAEDILQELARIKELIADAFDHFKTTRAGPNSAARAFAEEVLVIAGALEELDSRINADNLSQALGFYAQRVVELADFIPRSMDPDGKFYGYREYHGQERIERIEYDIVWFGLKISELLSDLENRIVSEEEKIYDSMMYEDDNDMVHAAAREWLDNYLPLWETAHELVVTGSNMDLDDPVAVAHAAQKTAEAIEEAMQKSREARVDPEVDLYRNDINENIERIVSYLRRDVEQILYSAAHMDEPYYSRSAAEMARDHIEDLESLVSKAYMVVRRFAGRY